SGAGPRALGGDRGDLPQRAELHQAGALPPAPRAGRPAGHHELGRPAEPIVHYGAGRAVPAGDVEALPEAVRELLTDSAALAAARAGADRARRELTWDAAAASHLALYEELG